MKFLFLAAAAMLAACSESARNDAANLDASAPPGRAKDAGHAGAHPDAARPPPPPPPTHVSVAKPHDAAVDAPGVPIVTAPGCSGELPVMTARDSLTFTEVEPDFGCYQRDAKDGGAVRDAGLDSGAAVRNISFHTVFQSLVAGATVDFFYGSSTLGTPFATRVLDADAGAATLSLPRAETVLSLRVHALSRASEPSSIVETREYGFRLSGDSSSLEAYALVSASRDLAVRLALGGSGGEDASKALLIADVRDCAGRPVNGAQVELVDGTTNEAVQVGAEADAPHVAYSYFALPTPTCTFTTDQQELATWVMVNAPVNVVNGVKAHPYRVRVTGRRQANAAPVVVVERDAELFEGVVSYMRP